MLKFCLSVLLCCVMLVAVPAFAQESNVTVNPDNITELIKTLESETARNNFIQNLKTLQETQGQKTEEEIVPPVLSEMLGLDGQLGDLAQKYEAFLVENDLNTSMIGKGVLTFGACIVFLALGFLVRKGGVSLRDRLTKMKMRFGLRHDRLRLYARMIRYCGYVIVACLFTYSLSAIWDITDFAFLTTDTGALILGNFLSIALIVVLGIAIWETINGVIEFGMRHSDSTAGKRLRTLLPIVRNVMFVVFTVLFVLILLSELGINIMPLLAGAGIFGIAIGFGAQSMVKDFLTGFTIILEDLIQVGDVATVGGRTGYIENITIRKVQMRALDGTVYTVPFSEISIVENLTKDFSYYLMDVGIAYRENTDEVIGYLKEVDEDLRADENFSDLILAPLEIFGVDKLADSAVMIKARIKTLPIRQWDVGREFNRRMKHKFDEKGIEIPFPHQTIYFGEDKQGNAPPAPVMIHKA